MHDLDYNAALSKINGFRAIDLHGDCENSAGMDDAKKTFSTRLRARIAEMGLTQHEAADRLGISQPRLNNYIGKAGRDPGLDVLAKIANTFGVSADWLLGLNSDECPKIAPLCQKILEMDGMPTAKAAAIGEVVQEAARLLRALPPEGDEPLRSRLAAQAAWLSKRDHRH